MVSPSAVADGALAGSEAFDREFSLSPGTALSWRELDGEWLVYDAGSGQTHLLDPLTAAVLGMIEAETLRQSALAALLAEATGPQPEAALNQALGRALDGLLAIDAIEFRAD